MTSIQQAVSTPKLAVLERAHPKGSGRGRILNTIDMFPLIIPLPNSPQPGHALHMLDKQTVNLTDIRVPAKRAKTLDAAKVQTMAEDIIDNGQITPIQVRADGKGFILVEGLHRLEALRALGETTVVAFLVQSRLH